MNKGLCSFAAAAGLLLALDSAFASSAEWLANPPNSDWNSAANWTAGGPPNGPADTATFQSSSISSPALSADVEANGIIFAGGANPYTITASSQITLTLSGSGIVNNSPMVQNFVIAENNGRIQLTHSGNAGRNTKFTINGATASGQAAGVMEFRDSSTAGNGIFHINGGMTAYADGGVMRFFDGANGSDGSFTINAGNGGATGLANGALLEFLNGSSAGRGGFVAMGGTTSEGGGAIRFAGSSTADIGSFTINGCAPDGGGSPGAIAFLDNSTAGNGTFITNGGGYAGVNGGGITAFAGHASAANGHFTINGTTQLRGGGGSVRFLENSSAGHAAFVINGSAFSNVCPPGDICEERPVANGLLVFFDAATASDSTLVANGGTDGGDGGTIYFAGQSTGSTAQVKVYGNASLYIDSRDSQDVTIGSLEGDGIVFIGEGNGIGFTGGARLIIGNANLSTSFSGVAKDGHPGGGESGALSKVGTGLLTLSGTNTYTGPTTIDGGKLVVDGSIVSPVTVNNGGTLGGSGTTHHVTVNNGGIVAPGGGMQPLHINGQYVQNAGGVLKIEVADGDPGIGHLDVTGDAMLDGTLEVRFVNGFLPATGQVFRLFHVAGTLSGSFAQVIFPDLRNGFQFQTEFVNGYYQITALNDGVAATGFLNISTRMQVGTGDNALIGGFIVTGTASKRVILRAIGPSVNFSGTPLPGRLLDPMLELRDGVGGLLFSNDNWKESAQVQEIIDSGVPPSDEHEAAIVAMLAPGNYTAVMRGVNNSTGIGIVEVYDLAQDVPAKLANISTRGFVETGDNVMIGGFIAGNQAMHVMARALGPSLAQSGVPNALTDPTVELHNAQGAVIAFNDDWQDTDAASIAATGIAPANAKESAILATVGPGNYTAILRGQNDTTGVGLVEFYDLQ